MSVNYGKSAFGKGIVGGCYTENKKILGSLTTFVYAGNKKRLPQKSSKLVVKSPA
jgi:hypothetical protein